MKHFKISLLALFILILINGCSSINKDEAEAKAISFINEKVKFFAKEENSTMDLPQYSIDSITSYQEGKNWIVLTHVSSKAGNETKSNDLTVKLNSMGEAVEFNGRKVPKTD